MAASFTSFVSFFTFFSKLKEEADWAREEAAAADWEAEEAADWDMEEEAAIAAAGGGLGGWFPAEAFSSPRTLTQRSTFRSNSI